MVKQINVTPEYVIFCPLRTDVIPHCLENKASPHLAHVLLAGGSRSLRSLLWVHFLAVFVVPDSWRRRTVPSTLSRANTSKI